MNTEKMGRCGLDCGSCSFKEPCNCPGCTAKDGKMFWGECRIAICNIEKNTEHCGMCKGFPCGVLKEFAHDKEHGDAEGSRIINIRRRMGEQV